MYYKSPIERYVSEIQTEFNKADEKELTATIKQSIGYKVDRDELLKALQYDRGQYDKGYNDGFNDGRKAVIAEIIEQYGDEVTE